MSPHGVPLNIQERVSFLSSRIICAGIKNVEAACCGKGLLNAEKMNVITESPNLCPNGREYQLWDMFQPTEQAAQLAALALSDGYHPLVVPMNFSQLAQI